MRIIRTHGETWTLKMYDPLKLEQGLYLFIVQILLCCAFSFTCNDISLSVKFQSKSATFIDFVTQIGYKINDTAKLSSVKTTRYVILCL